MAVPDGPRGEGDNAICLASLLLVAGCGGGSSNPGDGGTGASLTLTGTLVAGTQTPYPTSSLPPAPPPAPGDPLVGYQLYCVTFADPPTAATGTADAAGLVTIELAAIGVAFGCFVLDDQDAAVASLVFMSGLERGQTITLTGDTDLGTVTVDLGGGIALSAVPAGGDLTGGGDVACPLGEWTATGPPKDGCPGDLKSTFWVAQTTDGQYLMSFRVGPMRIGGGPDCTDRMETDVPVTVNDGVLTFTIPGDPTCPSKTIVATMTPNADCTELAAEMHYGNCASCDQGGCQCDGTLDCPMPSITAILK
ncbi:MAG: hypothetical protein HY906_10220 [Deltaproteobacteria bacterium]|nr:hypothetical protein [Deltaproteobacteria bacterium]